MASNLSTIGFAFTGEDDFAGAMVRLAGEARERLACAGGEYAIWRSRTGAEIWFQLSPSAGGDSGEIIGLTPFFEGVSDIRVKVTEIVRRPEDSTLEGAFTAWVVTSGDEDAESEGLYPLVFDAADFAAHCGTALPALRRIRLAGFAREVRAYPTAEAYSASQDRQPGLAPQAFVPMGLFAAVSEAGEEDTAPEPPSSAALLTGEIAEHRLLTNEVTGLTFHWILVHSYDATFDVLADPEVVTGSVVPGATVEVTCLMFGRFLD